MQKIHPFLWFHADAEKAVDFYMSVFPDGKILSTTYYPEGHPFGTPGKVMTVEFEICEQRFGVINGGDYYTMTGAVSFAIHCHTQEEVDYYWDKFAEGGKDMNCGWITDKFGVTWQVVPIQLIEMFRSPEKGDIRKLDEVMMKMEKLDIASLEEAFYG